MKSMAFFLMMASLAASAQRTRNEIKWNALGTIVFGSVEVGYEYFIDDAQSVGARVLINDVYNFSAGRQAKDFSTNSFQLSYQFYTGRSGQGNGFYIFPMLDATFGTYQRTSDDEKVDMDSFALGVGLGHKWNFRDKFTFGPYASIARNFSNDVREEFGSPIAFYAGFDLGYRF